MCHIGRRLPGFLIAATLTLVSTPASAQIDFTGRWNVRFWEDQEHRGPGGEMGDFTGIPLSAAGRARAETWDGAQYSQKEYQCRPHGSNYMFRSVHPVRITEDIDPVTGETIALHANFRDLLDRVVYLDGRPHPPEEAAHTWAGFSTGTWEGDTLVVSTTHLKDYLIRRDGPSVSDKATISERWIRHGDIFTALQFIYDPFYLTEPYVLSTDFQLDPRLENDPPQLCEIEEESNQPRGGVPHRLPGTNHDNEEFAAKHNLPLDAAKGGAETAYPEFRKTIKQAK